MYAFVKKNNILLLGAKRQSNIGLTREPSSAPALPGHYQVTTAAIYAFANASRVEALVRSSLLIIF